MTGDGIESEQMRVDRTQKDGVSKDCESTIHLPTTEAHIRWRCTAEDPQRPPASESERGGVAGRAGDVHRSIRYQRRGFKLIEVVGLIHPCEFQSADIAAMDLVETGIAMSRVSARISQPVTGGIRSVKYVFVSYLGCERRGQQRESDLKCSHSGPRSDER